MRERKMAIAYFRHFSFEISSEVPAFKVLAFASDLEFWIEVITMNFILAHTSQVRYLQKKTNKQTNIWVSLTVNPTDENTKHSTKRKKKCTNTSKPNRYAYDFVD